MLKIALTGGIGSGKTTVSDMFKSLGTPIIDTDVISRSLIQDHTVAAEVSAVFGNDILDNNGAIDRKKLAQIVFSDKDKKQQLEKILHPKIRDEVNRQVNAFDAAAQPPAYMIIVVPLLYETGFDVATDRTLVVIADENARIERVRQRDKRNMDEIRSIINSQVSDEKRIDQADDIIKNNNDFNQLESQIKHLHHSYTQLADSIK